ncbi:MAG: hypothetical protein GX444_00025 [Myxococcales bacterium]|nr:hypothetical protein [Myxococcales bacterium]
MNWKNMFLAAVILFALLIAFFAASCEQNDHDDDNSSPACQPTCWQNSPEQATGSLPQVEEWAAACEQADSGCADTPCVTTYLEFFEAPENLRYAVQCESGVSPALETLYDGCYGDEGTVIYLWLGAAYGFLVDTNCRSCGQPENRAPTGWANAPGDPQEWAGQFTWDEEKIAAVLAHEISDLPCEQITDYQQCVRAFIPPYTHCVPDPFSLANGKVQCGAADEPFDRESGWREFVAGECQE